MEGRPAGTTLEEALEVFEVFASGTLADEVYILDDVERQADRHRPGRAQGQVPEGVNAMSIITISHEMGAGGPEIGQQVAERLGYKYVDHELISETAHRYGLLEEKLEHLDETKPSLFERFDAETRRYITAMQTALYEFAEQDRVVLMGRGGQWLLRGVSARPARARDGAVRHPRQAARHEARRAAWASRRVRGRSPRWCGATTRRRRDACAISTTWT